MKCFYFLSLNKWELTGWKHEKSENTAVFPKKALIERTSLLSEKATLHSWKLCFREVKNKMKTPQVQKPKRQTVPSINFCDKSDENKHLPNEEIVAIVFHIFHIRSKPPQFWSADSLQNYPLFTGLRFERSQDQTRA